MSYEDRTAQALASKEYALWCKAQKELERRGKILDEEQTTIKQTKYEEAYAEREKAFFRLELRWGSEAAYSCVEEYYLVQAEITGDPGE